MDGSLDGSADGYAGRIEIYEGRSGRRMRSEAERARIAAESMAPGAKVSDVARRHAVTRWQVYDWRKKLMAGALALPAETADEPMFAALVLEPERGGPESSPKGCGSAIKPGRIVQPLTSIVVPGASPPMPPITPPSITTDVSTACSVSPSQTWPPTRLIGIAHHSAPEHTQCATPTRANRPFPFQAVDPPEGNRHPHRHILADCTSPTTRFSTRSANCSLK